MGTGHRTRAGVRPDTDRPDRGRRSSAPSPAEPMTSPPRRYPRRPGHRGDRPAPGTHPHRGGHGAEVHPAVGVVAVGLLMVLTGFVVLGLLRPATGGQSPDGSALLDVAPSSAGQVREGSVFPVDLAGPTANLPSGGSYSPVGRGTWHVIPGRASVATDVAGRRVVTYTVEAEDGIDSGSYAGDDAFAADVEAILADPRGWNARKNITLRRVDTATPDFRISLTSPMTTRSSNLCGFDIRYEGSCFNGAAGRVVINLARWTRGAMAYQGNIGAYRAYAISHEVGHALGENHQPCPAPGAPAPVMMQQSYGTDNAYLHQLNQADPAGHDVVPANPTTCRPNPWPAPSPSP